MNSICKTDSRGSKFWVIPNTGNSKLSYFNYGILHKEHGPAVEWDNGTKEWCFNGKLHRKDGPAKEWCNGTIDWYLYNKEIMPTNEMMEKYINLNPDNILKDYRYPLDIQLLAIKLKQDVIFNIKYPDPKLKEYYPTQMALRDSSLI